MKEFKEILGRRALQNFALKYKPKPIVLLQPQRSFL